MPASAGTPATPYITAPAGSRDPFMLQPQPLQPDAAGRAAVGAAANLHKAASTVGSATPYVTPLNNGSSTGGIQTPEELRRRFAARASAGDTTCNVPPLAAAKHPLLPWKQQRSVSRTRPPPGTSSLTRSLQKSYSSKT